ncbi:MAG: hypothetical protein AAGA68_07795, partial [Pseudomonadota bacterium]
SVGDRDGAVVRIRVFAIKQRGVIRPNAPFSLSPIAQGLTQSVRTTQLAEMLPSHKNVQHFLSLI